MAKGACPAAGPQSSERAVAPDRQHRLTPRGCTGWPEPTMRGRSRRRPTGTVLSGRKDAACLTDRRSRASDSARGGARDHTATIGGDRDARCRVCSSWLGVAAGVLGRGHRGSCGRLRAARASIAGSFGSGGMPHPLHHAPPVRSLGELNRPGVSGGSILRGWGHDTEVDESPVGVA